MFTPDRKRKICAVAFIIFLSFLIFCKLKDVWVENRIEVVRVKLFEKEDYPDSSLEKLLTRLETWSWLDPRVWELEAHYDLRCMTRATTNEERLQWAQKAVYASTKALGFAPTQPQYRVLREQSLRWEKVFLPQEK